MHMTGARDRCRRKARYETEADATAALRAVQEARRAQGSAAFEHHAYHCPTRGDHWHLTSKPNMPPTVNDEWREQLATKRPNVEGGTS
jgi:hypothetical protein